ncbi:unnamed protein product [Strongylus vulgaris]|uniref:Uncharacterized protein n=1 Tax=Strongylus vulgaris TaxID=40348 RepID=A0A3P7JR33_STRVU|nr:unnamed protein product [Strongylus vulgaris]
MRDTGERTSLASRDGGSIDTDAGLSTKYIFPSPVSTESNSSDSRRSSWMPRLLSRQRTSSMIRPQLIVSDYTQVDDAPAPS